MFNNPYHMYPYMNQSMNLMRTAPTVAKATKGGFFKSLAGIKWGSILTNTQKTLNVINQAIPVYYQIKPICSNLKSLGKIMSIFNESDNSNNQKPINSNQTNNINYNNVQTINSQNEITKKENSQGLPTFFIN